MNEQYLKGLHQHLGVNDDYDTWVNSVSGNKEYLQGLHNHLKIKDDYDTWYSSVWGSPEEDPLFFSPSQEEYVPASTEDFLAFTPSSEVADTDLGLSSGKSRSTPNFTELKNDFLIPEVKEKSYLEKLKEFAEASVDPDAKTFYDLEKYNSLSEYENGESRASVPDMFSMTAKAEEEEKEGAEQRLLLAEEVARQSVRNIALGTIQNTLANAVGGTVNNVKNSVASKVASRESALGNDFKAEQINTLLEADREEQERSKSAQQIALGVSEENARKGIFDTFEEGNISDGFKKLFVEGSYAAIDAPRTAAPFLAGMGVGAAVTGINIAADEYTRRLSDPTLSKSDKMAYAMSHATIESVLALGFGKAGLGLQNVASKIGQKALKEGSRKASSIVSSKGMQFLREAGGEGVEEGLVSALTQVTDQYLDSEFGKDPEKFSYNSVLDAAVLGIIGAGGPSSLTLSSMPSSKEIPHSAVAEEREQIDNELRDLKADYDSERDPDLKAVKKTRLEDKFRAFDALSGMEAEAYATLSDEDAVKVSSINRRMADLKMQIRSKKDLAGINYNEDQLKQKQEEFDSLNEVKKEIEGQAFSKAYAKENEGQLPLFAEDSEGNEVEVKPTPVAKEVVSEHAKLEEEPAEEITSLEGESEEKAPEYKAVNLSEVSSELLSNNEVPTEFHESITNLSKAFKDPLLKSEMVFHSSPDAYAKRMGYADFNEMFNKGEVTFGAVGGKTIHLYDYRKALEDRDVDASAIDTIEDTVRHEFSHAALNSVIGERAESRSRLFEEMQEMSKDNKSVADLISKVEGLYDGAQDSEVQEEAIVALLVDYAANPSKYKSVAQRIIDAINSVLSQFGGANVITNETDLMALARSYEVAAKTGKKTEVKTKADKAAQARESKAKFTYLNDAEIFYDYVPAVGATEEVLKKRYKNAYRSEKKSINVNDYNHFKNWYNKLTGNGRANVVQGMYHIVDGKKKPIKPPKKKLNADGTPAWIERPLTFRQKEINKSIEANKRRVERVKETTALRAEARGILSGFGLDPIYVNIDNFIPRDSGMPVEQFRYVDKTPEMYESAIRNIQALIESGIDPNAYKGKSFFREDNVDMFTMAEGDYMTPQEKVSDEMTKPDTDGSPRHIETFRFSATNANGRSLSEESYALIEDSEFANLDPGFKDGDVVVGHGYDKSLNSQSGQVNLGKYFSVNMNSGVTTKSILSAASEEKAKGLVGKLESAVELAKSNGKSNIKIHYTAQNERHLPGNVQVFETLMDFYFNYYKKAMGGIETPSEQKASVKRLNAFLNKKEGSSYIVGSKSEPGVIETLRVGLPRFMSESGNQDYTDFLSRNNIDPKESKRKRLLIRIKGADGKDRNPSDLGADYDVVYSAIKEFINSRDINTYISPVKENYPKANEISYLKDFFAFRENLANAFMSPKDGLYGKEGHPAKTVDNIEVPKGKRFGPSLIKSFFINPLFKDFEPGQVMAIRNIEIKEGETFSISKNEQTSDSDPFPFSITYGEEEVSFFHVPRKKYHFLDLNNDLAIKLFDEQFEKELYKFAERAGVSIEAMKESPLYDRERLSATKKALSNMMTSSGLRSGISGVINLGVAFSMARSANIRDISSPDYQRVRSSRANLFETNDDYGNTWKMRTRSSIQSWRDLWLVRLQDKYRMVFLLQQDIESFKGKSVKETEDFKMAEERMYGMASEALSQLDNKLNDVTAAMKSENVKIDELSEYMYALHAEERNKVIAERTEGEVEDGSGITNEEANDIINSIPEDRKGKLDSIVEIIRGIQQDTRNTMVKYGLETKETIDAFEEMFSNYVPLSGLARDEDSSVSSPYPTGGAGLSVFGDQTKRAKGRKTRAENVLAQAVAQNASVHIEARKNEAMNALYNLVKNNPNPNVWRIVDTANALDPHTVAVRVNGEQKFIRFKDASYAATLKNMNQPQTNQFIRLLRMPSNWLRAAFTTQNPEFPIQNFSRDIQSAVFNAAAEAEIEGGALNSNRAMKSLFNNVFPSLKALLKESVGKEGKADPVMIKYYQEFKEDGGKTGWAYMKPLEELAEQLENASKEKTRTQEILGKPKQALDFVEGINDAFENSIRLASYIAARESGTSRGKAAQLAKNITVNFNKHGEWGQTLNAVYLFFNASVQGTARVGKSLTGLKPPVKPDGSTREWYERATTAQKLAGGLTLFSSMLTMIGMAMSDEDEDGELYWNKIPDYVKERNLIIMRTDGENYFKIPMPYGFNVFANMGTAAVEGASGDRDFADASMFVASSFINSFSPISFGQSKDLSTKLLKSVVPTPLKPLADIATNETYFGSPVYSEQFPFGAKRPESSMSFRSPEEVKQFFSWMNDATGGTQDVPGSLDMNPDKLWYTVEYFMGGPGMFVERTSKTVRRMKAKAIDKEDIDLDFNDVPMMRIIYGEPSKYYDYELFSNRQEKVKQLKREVKRTKDFSNPRYKGLKRLDSAVNEINKSLKALRAKRREARDIKDFGKRTAEVQRLMDLERKQVMKFNKLYNELRED